jgi:putative two-component system response regulator
MHTLAAAPRPTTILVVDDNSENLTVLSTVLRPDHRVRVASDGPKALEIAESDDPPDLILLDVMMPGMSGFEVCAELKANPRTRHIPVIFVTALGQADDERHGLALGAIDYITKPITPSLVSARVRNHLELNRARAALARQNATLELAVAERTRELVQANQELTESYLETIDLAYAVMSEADDFLGNHCKRVATYARAIAERLGFGEAATLEVYVAALLHDLGLVGLHGAELKRLFRLPSPSPTGERTYWAHPMAHTRSLLTSVRFARTAAIISGHHENLDGTGFPGRMRGDAILLGSRVLAVADRWDVFAQLEPPVRGKELGFLAFAQQNVDKLDAHVVEAFGEILRRGDPFSKVVERCAPELEPGMVLARTIHSLSGATLLSAGTTLRRDHIRDLARHAEQGELRLPIHVYRDEAVKYCSAQQPQVQATDTAELMARTNGQRAPGEA